MLLCNFGVRLKSNRTYSVTVGFEGFSVGLLRIKYYSWPKVMNIVSRLNTLPPTQKQRIYRTRTIA